MKTKKEQIRSRNQDFTQRPVTRIWDEQTCPNNPYIAETVRCHGYELIELMEKRSYVDVLFLLFRGELPTIEQAKLFQRLMIALINPGPRHPATRAAMNAGVGKTNPVHILPIGLSIMGGEHLGAGMIEETIKFFRQASKTDASKIYAELSPTAFRSDQGDFYPAPGFGSRFGGRDALACSIAEHLATLPAAGKALLWGNDFAECLRPQELGWLLPGVAAAVFSDLGFHPRTCAGLFQFIQAPGLLAHGLEMANKPLTAMPFPSDKNYIIEE